jgi:hypothetical protein
MDTPDTQMDDMTTEAQLDAEIASYKAQSMPAFSMSILTVANAIQLNLSPHDTAP